MIGKKTDLGLLFKVGFKNEGFDLLRVHIWDCLEQPMPLEARFKARTPGHHAKL